MAICHAEASRIGVRSHSGLRLEWARYPTAKWLACAGASMRFGSLIWNNQTALAKAATEHPAQTRRARPGLFRGSQAALRRRSAGIKRASPAEKSGIKKAPGEGETRGLRFGSGLGTLPNPGWVRSGRKANPCPAQGIQ